MERDDIQSETLRRLFDYWDGLHGDSEMPSRTQIDPVAIPPTVLPHVMLLEVERGPFRLKIRLMGTHLAESYGEEVTGRYMDELDLGCKGEEILQSYAETVVSHKPAHIEGHYRKHDGRHIKYERIALPLSLDGRNANRLLVGVHFEIMGDYPLLANDNMKL